MAGYFLRLTPEELAKAREKLRRRRLPPVILSPSEIQSARLRVKGLGPRIPAPSHELRAIRMKMLELINHDRREYPEESRQAHPLVWHEGVAHVAQEHSEDMLRRKFMAHENPEGLGPGDRLLAAGIRFVYAGENLAGSPSNGHYTGYPSVEAAQHGLMDEPPYQPNHRANILNPHFTHVGIGIAWNADGTLVIAQDFVGI